MNDHAKRIVLNTKGTKDKEGHEVSDEIKAMLSYMDGNAPESEYSKMLDDAVKQIKGSQERRLEYMNLNVFSADERELGDYRRVVSQIRGNNDLLSDDAMIKFMKISPEVLQLVRKVISEHPDWDDEEVADEVLAGLD